MNLCKMLKRKDVGSTGIGAMIVFIAVVLVAGIAASVLIQTSMKLETAAMTSGQQTIEEVAGGIAIFDITGKKDATLGNLQLLGITVRPRAGSPNLDLNHTIIEMTDGTTKALLSYDYAGHYNGTVDTGAHPGDLFGTGTWTTLTSVQFGIIVLEDADGSCAQFTPVINSGDKVVLTICCGAAACFGAEIPTRTDVYGRIIPEQGSPGIISLTTPAAYNDAIMDLQ